MVAPATTLSHDDDDDDEREQNRRRRHSEGATTPPTTSSFHYKRDVLAVVLVLTGLYWFAASFFLAKQSLVQTSECDEAVTLLQTQLGLTSVETDRLVRSGILSPPHQQTRAGCWMDRRASSMIMLLVDALRFDFAYYNFPRSIGQRLKKTTANINNHNGKQEQQQSSISSSFSSRLFQFIADPPTVTMQRLKGLTTGGLPTFADISANFGGASVPEDSWVKQLLLQTPFASRGLLAPTKAGFVGDDTWEDLFPAYFTESHPYPSFNTRDLETVDNGCLQHLPFLLQKLRTDAVSGDTQQQQEQLEVVVVHFLGVDHVGHTYGPHNEHMDAKLRQMDAALATVLELLDEDNSSCRTALIFGDHGMTQDGNHGGGTLDETHAALFVHASPACGSLTDTSPYLAEVQTTTEHVAEAFSSLNQIDLVPAIALMLGLPIPFANLGGLVPSLLPRSSRSGSGDDIQSISAALALNAAQVWRYFVVYSTTANRLPHLEILQERLILAVIMYKEALQQQHDFDESVDPQSDTMDDTLLDKYAQSATLFKTFLTEALELGQRVWTRFDTVGMICGVLTISLGLILYAIPLVPTCSMTTTSFSVANARFWELLATVVFSLFLCGILTFSNSYILQEEDSVMFCLAIISLIVALRIQSDPAQMILWRGVAMLPIASRLDELFVSGHGMDPSIRLHLAHNAMTFLTSLLLLGAFRWFLYQKRVTESRGQVCADILTLFCFAGSWCEKRTLDPDRNGYWFSSVALVTLFAGIPMSILQAIVRPTINRLVKTDLDQRMTSDVLTIVSKLLIAIMGVTGPSAATSLVLYSFQATVIYFLAMSTGPTEVNSFVVAGLWRLVTRHVFFATNHGCSFNRLQYSAAFIATKEFYFGLGGISLFLNTFGWEMVGIVMAWLMSRRSGRSQIYRAYGFYQLVEALSSCLSVSLLRRHLMVWDIYAPHFLFAAIFTVLSSLSQLTVLVMTNQ